MKAIILKPFTMGNLAFRTGAEVDLEPWRVVRLEGEGLARAVAEEVKDAATVAVDNIPQPAKRAKHRRK